MNIVNRVTLQHMKQNRRRTLVTILGVIIAVAMITAVTTITGSFMDLFRRNTIRETGLLHVLFEQVPAERLDDLLKVAAHLKEGHPNLPIRINTNGLADLIWHKPTAPMLKGLIDCVSVSLNAMDAEEYLKLTRSKFGIGSFDAMLKFTKECTQYVPHVMMTVVDEPVTTPEEQEICKGICEKVGATLRVRPYED